MRQGTKKVPMGSSGGERALTVTWAAGKELTCISLSNGTTVGMLCLRGVVCVPVCLALSSWWIQ